MRDERMCGCCGESMIKIPLMCDCSFSSCKHMRENFECLNPFCDRYAKSAYAGENKRWAKEERNRMIRLVKKGRCRESGE